MPVQRSEPQERSYQEALATLQRLASVGQPPPPAPIPQSRPLPPRAAPLPAWSEQSFRELVEGLPDGVVVIDARGVIALINRQTERLFGYPRDELLGEAIEVLVPERFRGRHVALRDGYLAAPRTRPLSAGMELFGRRKDGSEFPVEISLSPLGAGRGLLVTAVIRDLTERKRSEAKFRTLVENIPAVTFVAPLDDSTPELYVSPQIEKLLGFTQKEWVEDPVLWHRQLHPEDRDRWNRHFAPTCSTGEPFRSTYRFLAKDGRTVWVHGSANVVRDQYNRLLFLQGVAFDVTAIKEAEEERERFFSLSLDLFCVAGMDGYFRRVNQAFSAVLGYSIEELLQRPFLELVHPDDREATSAQLAGLARGEPTERFENRYRCRDGSYRWLQWVAAPFTERQLCFAAARDVTREKQDEEALREQARLAALRADVSAAITGSDTLEGMLGRCVQALADDLGLALVRIWTFDEGEGVLRLLASAGLAAAPEWPDASVASGHNTIGQIAALRQPFCTDYVIDDGSIGDQEWARRVGLVAFAGYPLSFGDRLVGVLGLFSRRVVTPATRQTLELIAAQVSLGIKRRQAEDALLQANAELERRVQERTEALTRLVDQLEERNEELQKYAHHATHDIKEPLRTVLSQTQHAIRDHAGQLPGDVSERLGKVVSAVGRMQILLERLKDYAKVNVVAQPVRVDCVEAVGAALISLEAAIEECQGEVVIQWEAPPIVIAVKEHLELLFQNLIGNALKYRSPARPPRVEVGAKRHGDGWLFWVKDNGEGIEPKYWQRIFGIGERLDAKKSGWGYGLAICEKTVSRHGGRIWVASEPGQGSTFYFALPDQPPGWKQ
jgi:PAS domain S-box-containing protein